MNDLYPWLRLQHSERVGTVTARKLLNYFPDLDSALRAGRTELAASGIAAPAIEALLKPVDERAIERDRTWASAPGNHLIPLISERYPARLRSIINAPLVLYVSGDAEVLHTAQLAVVGSRNPTQSGLETARQFARHIAAMGITITSGLALGIDAASHMGALDVDGLSIAVSATGLDRVYPAQHQQLANRILEEGALVSESPIGTPVRAAFFPRRNRIISGLSLGVLVVEATVRSGSLGTAQHAVEQGREVFAIPGSIHSPMARGCHRLIKQGAKLIELAEEVLEELAPQLSESCCQPANGSAQAILDSGPGAIPHGVMDTTYRQLLDCIDYEPQTVDTLVERSGLVAAEVASMLLMLELEGQVSRLDGGKYTRCR